MMLEDPISKVIFKMAMPTIVAFLINSIYSLADTYFVSSIGINATAAVSVNASLDQLIMMMGSMLAVGANSYIARLLGQGGLSDSQGHHAGRLPAGDEPEGTVGRLWKHDFLYGGGHGVHAAHGAASGSNSHL